MRTACWITRAKRWLRFLAVRRLKMVWGRRRGDGTIVAGNKVMESLMPQRNDLSRCVTAFEQNGTIVAVVEMSQSSWLVAGIVPGVARHPLKKLAPDATALLILLQRWRDEATKAGCRITRIAVAY